MENIKQILLCTLFFSVSLWSQNSEISISDLNLPKIWCSNTLYSGMEFEKIRKSFEKSLTVLTTRDSILEFHKSVSQPLNSDVYLIKNACIKTVSSTSYHYQSNTNELYYKDFNEDKVTLLKNL
ncbi:hypothetical protein OAP64_03165 [Flavobacteriaceae bacterium]|nr:hypothetical protein [Flavobacteriaceae bacterium]